MSWFVCLIIFSSLSLLLYGLSCLCSRYMVDEFERYGLPKFRKLVGLLECLGGVGLLCGLYFPLIGLLAASGLALLLLSGFAVRMKIKDGVLKSIPAAGYCLINFYLAILFFKESMKY